MNTIEFIETADANRQLHLTIPVEEPSTRYRVTVSIERDAPTQQASVGQSGKLLDVWPPGFVDRTFGGWQGELERASQGKYEERTKF